MAKLSKREMIEMFDAPDSELIPVWVQEIAHPDHIWAAILDMLRDGRVVAVYGLNLYFSEDTYGRDWVAWDVCPDPPLLSRCKMLKQAALCRVEELHHHPASDDSVPKNPRSLRRFDHDSTHL